MDVSDMRTWFVLTCEGLVHQIGEGRIREIAFPLTDALNLDHLVILPSTGDLDPLEVVTNELQKLKDSGKHNEREIEFGVIMVLHYECGSLQIERDFQNLGANLPGDTSTPGRLKSVQVSEDGRFIPVDDILVYIPLETRILVGE